MTFGTFLACVSYGLGINPAAVRVFRNCGQKIVFHRLFDHVSHGLGIDPASFLMHSLGDVRALFWLVFRMVWASILLLFECFATADKRLFSIGFSIVFRMVWASILLAF